MQQVCVGGLAGVHLIHYYCTSALANNSNKCLIEHSLSGSQCWWMENAANTGSQMLLDG